MDTAAITVDMSGRSSGNSSMSALRSESNIAMKCNAVFPTVAHLCAPVAGQSVLIEEDHGETSNFYGF